MWTAGQHPQQKHDGEGVNLTPKPQQVSWAVSRTLTPFRTDFALLHCITVSGCDGFWSGCELRMAGGKIMMKTYWEFNKSLFQRFCFKTSWPNLPWIPSHTLNETKLGSIFVSPGSQKVLNLLPSPQQCSVDPTSSSLRIQPQDIGPKELLPKPHL